MLNYRVNIKKLSKTSIKLPVENLLFTDFETLVDNSILTTEYDGNKLGKIMVTCECLDIDKINNGSTINVINTLYLNMGENEQEVFTFNQDYNVVGVNRENKSFSFYYDKFVLLIDEKITSGEDNEDKIILYFKDLHYFDAIAQDISLRFKYITRNNLTVKKDISFKYLSPKALVTSYEDFDSELYELIFDTTKQDDSDLNKLKYVNRFDNNIKINEEQYQALEDSKKSLYIINNTTKYGHLGSIEVYRKNYIFEENTDYEFMYERPLVDIKIPIVNTFDTTLYQMELLQEQFVNAEKKKVINRIVDIEKDVYYPSISNAEENVFADVYTIKFNLHFREHRGDDWLVENGSFWNCVEQVGDTASIVNTPVQMTNEDRSDLLTFLGFTNNDVRYQKNKLKKSFLRLMYYDSTNPANQNMIGYSTIFFNTGDMFSKYIKHIKDEGYVFVGADKNDYGIYSPSQGKVGIRVDRDYFINDDNDSTRLGAQFVVKSKNMSKSSSEGFYIYIWKDNEMALPQDLYVKIEFNHAGYGRTIPFMMPYWDRQKWSNKSGIKSFQEILDDWNSKAQNNVDRYNRVVWKNGNDLTDGHYGIKQYTKFSYIHLKYCYDKESDKHIYYLDPNTYGDSVTDTTKNEIVINLYEAKVE